jgi:hypothetical protein
VHTRELERERRGITQKKTFSLPTGEQQCVADGREAVTTQKSHQEPEPEKDHDRHITEERIHELVLHRLGRARVGEPHTRDHQEKGFEQQATNGEETTGDAHLVF